MRTKQILPVARIILLLVLSFLITFGIISSSIFKDINHVFYDFWFTFRDLGRRALLLNKNISIQAIDKHISNNIVIIGIDEKSISSFHAYPWSRMKYVELFEYLNSAPLSERPAAVLLDILFVDQSKKKIDEEFYLKNPEQNDISVLESEEFDIVKNTIEKYQIDKPLGNAIKECGRVFLPFLLLEGDGSENSDYKRELDLIDSFSITAEKNRSLPSYQRIMAPVYDISSHAKGIGSVTIEEKGIEILREIPLFARFDPPDNVNSNDYSQYYPSIDLLIALDYFNLDPANVSIKWGSHVELKNAIDPVTGEKNNIFIPIDKEGNVRINYRAPHKSFSVRSFSDVRRGRIPLEYFANKYVLVGIMATGASHDFWISPVGGMYGIEHHANVLNTLIHHDFLYTFPDIIIYSLIILFTFGIGFLTYKQKFILSSIITIALIAALFIISIITFYFNIVFPFTHILLAILITFIITIVYKGFTGELAITGLSRDIRKQIEYNKGLKADLTELVESTINATIEQVSDIDGYTGLHNEVLGILGNEYYNLKQYIYFSKSEAEIFRLARLHDIGKINVNPNILRKRGRLSGSEYEEIKWHTIAGGRYLERFKEPAFQDAARIAIGHQESWDGVNGYPAGIPNAIENIDIRNGEKIRWNRILDFMAVLDTFHAMTSNRPYRKGLNLEIVFRELVCNANTQFSSEALEEFFRFFYRLYKNGMISVVGRNDTVVIKEMYKISVNSHDPEKIDNLIEIHIRMMELFNSPEKLMTDQQQVFNFDELKQKITGYILVDEDNQDIQKMKQELYSIFISKQKIKHTMTTYMDDDSRLRLLGQLRDIHMKQLELKENIFIKKKYKQLYIKKIMLEYYNLISEYPLKEILSLYRGGQPDRPLVRKIVRWYTSSLDALAFVRRLINEPPGLSRYNNICRFLDSTGVSRHTACYMGDILFTIYKYFNEKEQAEFFKKIDLLYVFIEKIQFPDSSRIIHSFLSYLDTALINYTEGKEESVLDQWNNLFTIVKTYRDNMILSFPAGLNDILQQKTKPVPCYNIFTLLMELIGAYYVENHNILKERWITLFEIMGKLNELKNNVYQLIRDLDEEQKKQLLSMQSEKTARYFDHSFEEHFRQYDLFTYLLQGEKDFLLKNMNTPFLDMIFRFFNLDIWKSVYEIEEAYVVLKNIERKDYISDVHGSFIRMFRDNNIDSNQKVDIFRQAMNWIEDCLEIV